MANLRIRRKRDRLTQQKHKDAEGSRAGLYEPRTVAVAVPCSECAFSPMMRTYLPGLGSMNGSVACPICKHKDAYLNALASSMTTLDPLPEDYRTRSRPAPLSDPSARRIPRPSWQMVRRLAHWAFFGSAPRSLYARSRRFSQIGARSA